MIRYIYIDIRCIFEDESRVSKKKSDGRLILRFDKFILFMSEHGIEKPAAPC